ncbi:type II secretion system F family protein [Methylotenera mobilis]|uniref:Type II secretion system protein n=1 Tax=Methylotenera mobilis (strain JLW8 / ATCC BAA-1282 / DSM 17540) TaxID=583345 RepID=C6WW00_METML|nr:type II secretion system F family protein [Methylotenera mobilis]ACT48099.1 type II secretion system protein [Methylotenera mobilis JLW8]
MPSFVYKGRDSQGVLVQGTIESIDSSNVASQLSSLNITPIEIKAQSAKTATKEVNFNLFKEKISTLDVMLFSRQMYTLLKAGIPIMNALNGLQASTQNKAFSLVIGNVRESLAGGRELSVALAQHPSVFSSFYVSMVRVGESTGLLDSVFFRLFEHIEFERFMRDQIKAALRYPTFVVIAMAVAIVVVNLFVIPAFAKVFQSFGVELPLMTRGLLAFSGFMQAFWPYLLALIVGAVFLFRSYTATSIGRYNWDGFKLKIPIAGKIVHKATMARFARSFALSSKSGVPITNGLKLVAQTADNDYVGSRIDQMREGVERGESILRTATNSGVFNPIVLQMIAVGEESGSLDDLMEEIADMYQRDVEYEIKTLGAQIEPILIVFLGVMVLILALGIFLPIWDLGNVALHKG